MGSRAVIRPHVVREPLAFSAACAAMANLYQQRLKSFELDASCKLKIPSLDKSNDDRELSRRQARIDAHNHATFPTFVVLNGVEVPIAKFAEIEALGGRSLRRRAMNLRDIIEATQSNFFGHYKHMVLRVNS